ncbi:hypothetical protein LMTR13_12780 [Bradyrhizobium icense]|uniref:Uncharacterized protein n=1 Tax=Bradyrhizobium icense TaxID=1274631 RepID=A0A1B1UE10_9BRAD|nr:hypothetical protein LMTR13_12780 [Bradyrhizobium icense]
MSLPLDERLFDMVIPYELLDQGNEKVRHRNWLHDVLATLKMKLSLVSCRSYQHRSYVMWLVRVCVVPQDHKHRWIGIGQIFPICFRVSRMQFQCERSGIIATGPTFSAQELPLLARPSAGNNSDRTPKNTAPRPILLSALDHNAKLYYQR